MQLNQNRRHGTLCLTGIKLSDIQSSARLRNILNLNPPLEFQITYCHFLKLLDKKALAFLNLSTIVVYGPKHKCPALLVINSLTEI